MKSGDKQNSKKIRARLSFSGWIYVLLSLLVGLAAVNSNNNVLFLITSLLLSLLFLSGLTALYNVSGIRVRALGRGILTSEEQGVVMVRVENTKRFSSLVLDVSLGSDLALVPVISAKSHKDVYLTWAPPHRGKPRLQPVGITSSFPFGFVRRGGFFDTGTGIVTSPRPAGNIPELLSSRDEEQKLISSRGHGRGDWKGIRQYRPGEGKASIVWRRIDWHKPGMTRDSSHWPAHSFAHESSKSLVLEWDDPLYAHLDTEKRLSLLRTVLDRVALDNEVWELRLPEKKVIGQGRVNYERGLQALALVEPLPIHNP